MMVKEGFIVYSHMSYQRLHIYIRACLLQADVWRNVLGKSLYIVQVRVETGNEKRRWEKDWAKEKDAASKGLSQIGKRDMLYNDHACKIDVNPEKCKVKAKGMVGISDPAWSLSMARPYSLFYQFGSRI
ncbi:MAG TPA: hypothetical protein VHA09_06290 [Nitrososphaera sp.]|nr:hypothetical protein [Nitrososphaera sp.]